MIRYNYKSLTWIEKLSVGQLNLAHGTRNKTRRQAVARIYRPSRRYFLTADYL